MSEADRIKAERIENYPMKLVDLIVKTDNFDTTLNVELEDILITYNIKFQRKDASMQNKMTLTIGSQDIYTKMFIPNNKDKMIVLVASVLNYMNNHYLMIEEMEEDEG